MILNKKLKYFIIVVIIANISAFCVILFLLNSIGKDAQLLSTQKKELFRIEKRAENSEKLEKKYQDYNLELKKIDNLFAEKSMLIEFIEFLEQTADSCSLTTEISALSFQGYKAPKKGEPAILYPWDFFNIKISTQGDFNNSFIFLRKLENSPYLMEIENLDIRKQEIKEKGTEQIIDFISANLSIKVYAK